MSGSIWVLVILTGLALIVGVVMWMRLWRRSDVGDDLYPEVAEWTILRPSRESKSGLSTAGIIAMSGLFTSDGSGGLGGGGGPSCGDGSGGACS